MQFDNLIIVKGGSYNDIKKALGQWIDLYSDDLLNDFTIELIKNGRGSHILKVDERLDNERFYYLVNYLNYPEGIEYRAEIEGFTTGKDENILKNHKLLVYIPNNDTEGDNVYAVTNTNKDFKIDFGGKISEVNCNRTFKLPDNINFDNPEVIKVNKKESKQRRIKQSKDKVPKRFRIISLIALGLFLLSLLTSYYDTLLFAKFIFFFGMGLGFWFYIDYEMLQVDKYYIYSLMISIAFLGYAIIIKQNLDNINVNYVDLGAFYPITLLIVQKPTRLIFKLLLKREPIIDKPPPTFWDGVYTIILFFTFLFLPFLIIDLLK